MSKFRISFLFFLLSMFVATALALETKKTPQAAFIEKLYQTTLLNHPTHDMLRELCTQYPKRLTGSDGAAGAVQWAKKTMEGLGFDNVRLQPCMVPHWERGAKEVAYAEASDGQREHYNVIALGRSIATANTGVRAEVLMIPDVPDLKNIPAALVKGKIVFFNKAFDDSYLSGMAGYGNAVQKRVYGPSEAARKGALAVVIRSVTTARDDFPHTGTLVYKADAPKIPAAALGYQSADKLQAQLERDPRTKLYLRINSTTLPDVQSYNVIGELKGSEHPDEIIVVGGHLDDWDVGQGAQDDGAGVTHSINALRMLKKLGYKPKHTIRCVAFMNEEYGTRGGKEYAAQAKKNHEKHIIAFESDAGGFAPRGFGFSGSDASLQKIRSWLKYFPMFTIDRIRKGGGGTDIGPLKKEINLPLAGLIPDSQRYFDFHHSGRDVFSAVNRRELEMGTASIAAFIYLVDQMGL